MHAFTSIASQGDVGVSKDIIDKVVHSWLFELAILPIRGAREFAWTFDFFRQEIANVWVKNFNWD